MVTRLPPTTKLRLLLSIHTRLPQTQIRPNARTLVYTRPRHRSDEQPVIDARVQLGSDLAACARYARED